LAECLLTEVRNTSVPKPGGPLLLDNPVVLRTPMDRQADALLLAFHDRFAGGFIGADSHQGHLAGWSFGTILIDEWEEDFFDDFEDRLGLKGRAVQPMLDLDEELGIQGLRVQTLEDLTLLIANAHRELLSEKEFYPPQ